MSYNRVSPSQKGSPLIESSPLYIINRHTLHTLKKTKSTLRHSHKSQHSIFSIHHCYVIYASFDHLYIVQLLYSYSMRLFLTFVLGPLIFFLTEYTHLLQILYHVFCIFYIVWYLRIRKM